MKCLVSVSPTQKKHNLWGLKKKFPSIAKETLSFLKGSPEFLKVQKILGSLKSVDLHFCDDVEMRSFQKQFRKLDRTTDVLSFPSIEAPEGVPSGYLGSIVFSLDTVERNAKRYKHSNSAELAEVFVHGLLHLFGFDHVKVSRAKALRMRSVQKKIVAKLPQKLR